MPDATSEVRALTATVKGLVEKNSRLMKENADLKAEVKRLTKPAANFPFHRRRGVPKPPSPTTKQTKFRARKRSA